MKLGIYSFLYHLEDNYVVLDIGQYSIRYALLAIAQKIPDPFGAANARTKMTVGGSLEAAPRPRKSRASVEDEGSGTLYKVCPFQFSFASLIQICRHFFI